MSTPFLGEIKIISWNFPPKGWAFCNGQLLAISQNQALFALLGTYYGGDGIQNLALPNLQGRSAMHVSGGYPQGQAGGEQAHTLNAQEMPAHNHPVMGTTASPSSPSAAGHLWCGNSNANAFSVAAPDAIMNPACVTNSGGSQPHDNMSPYLVVNFVIALQGIFPSRN